MNHNSEHFPGIRNLTIFGCGFMGQSLLKGWLRNGFDPSAIYVQDPNPNDWVLTESGITNVNADLPIEPDILVLAVKPQLIPAVLPELAVHGGGKTTIISIAAGVTTDTYESYFGKSTPIIRVMPNLPSAVGVGTAALFANSAGQSEVPRAISLMRAVGEVVELSDEAMMHAITAVSGSGPAFVFSLAEALVRSAETLGLPKDIAQRIGRNTVAGAGAMLAEASADPTQLRQAVTSKGGTTAAGLEVLSRDNALDNLIFDTVRAAASKSRELGEAP